MVTKSDMLSLLFLKGVVVSVEKATVASVEIAGHC